MTFSFHVLSNLLLIDHPLIWAVDNAIKNTKNKLVDSALYVWKSYMVNICDISFVMQ
jgi:hypothetical protein